MRARFSYAFRFCCCPGLGFAQPTISIPIPKTQQQISGTSTLRSKKTAAAAALSWRMVGLSTGRAGGGRPRRWPRGFLSVLSISFRGDEKTRMVRRSRSVPLRTMQQMYWPRLRICTRRASKKSQRWDQHGWRCSRRGGCAIRSGEIERIVLLGSSGGDFPAKLKGRKLFLVARDDRSGSGPRLPEITRHYEKRQLPKS